MNGLLKMLFRYITTWILLGVAFISARAESPAHIAYGAQMRGQYAQAIATYDSLWQIGYESADLHYNLSLAYYGQQDFGRAMLHMEKAARVKPYDHEVKTNLRLLRNEQVDGILPLPRFFLQDWALSLGARLGVTGWSILSLLCAFGAVIILWLGLGGRMHKLWPAWMVGLVVLSIVGILLASYRQSELARMDQAILLANEVSPQAAPDTNSTVASFTIHAGLRLHILDRFEGWTKIQLPDGREGWLLSEQVGEI